MRFKPSSQRKFNSRPPCDRSRMSQRTGSEPRERGGHHAGDDEEAIRWRVMTDCGGPLWNVWQKSAGWWVSSSGYAWTRRCGCGRSWITATGHPLLYGRRDKGNCGGGMEACLIQLGCQLSGSGVGCCKCPSVNNIHSLCVITIVCPHGAFPSRKESPIRGSLPWKKTTSAHGSDRNTE